MCLFIVQAAGAGPARSQARSEPFRIALMVGLAGPFGPAQQAFVEGAQIAGKVLNTKGGILGRSVDITVFDIQFDPARAVRMLQQDVLTQRWDMIWPGGGALTTGPMLPFVTRAKILAFATFLNTNPEKLTTDNPYFFDILPNPLDAAAAFTQYAQKLGVKKLGILYQSDAFGIGSYRAYEPVVSKAGIQIVSEPYDVATIDITPTLLKLKAQNPDRLYVIANGAPAGHVLNSLDKLGWKIPIIGDQTFGITDLRPLATPKMYENLVVTTYRMNVYVPPEKRSPSLRTFLNILRAEGPITQSLYSYTAGWDTIMLTALAAQQANSTDQLQMVKALEHLNLTPKQRTYLSFEEYNFTPTNHQVYTGPGEYSFVKYAPFRDGMIGQ
jgi:branched-chain amino acid transport system substrate-binding protein